jgi:hypothetical protein
MPVYFVVAHGIGIGINYIPGHADHVFEFSRGGLGNELDAFLYCPGLL